MFRFATPYAFGLLLAIPLIVWYRHRRQRPAMAASSVQAAAGLAASPALMFHRLLPWAYYFALVLLVAALARPQWGMQRLPIETPGINIILALDLSESMAALDFQHDGKIINRLAAVKTVVADFIGKRSTDRMGVVVFGSQAYTQLPLTRDYATIAAILERLEIGAAGRSTAIGDAIGISLKRLADIESRSNIIILITDGRSNSGELQPEVAAGIAAGQGVKIHTIGVGGQGRAPFLINDPVFGRRYVYQEVDMDEAALKAIAETTGGLYFRAQDMEELQGIYTVIDAMEKTKVQAPGFAEYEELYLFAMIPAFALLGIWIILKNTRFISIP
ncbi:MAG: VWA domain-containing protein [Desulfobacteraceae bacterium]|nr:MAG: VWA domain-containing protein [Desulfobacteraceae bacterium]